MAFAIPLCYTHTNPSKYCSLSTYWNNVALDGPTASRSIFRHLIQGQDTIMHNWMMDLFQLGTGNEWDSRFLSLDGTSHFWLALVATGADDQRFGSGSRTLVATMTFKLQDTMEICIDSCFWPPTTRMAFLRSDAQDYIPRHFLPRCDYIGPCYPGISCPMDEIKHVNGTYQSGILSASCHGGGGNVSSVETTDPPSGINNVQVVYGIPPQQPYVEGHVIYTVTDHCRSGGSIRLKVYNDFFNCCMASCSFNVLLGNTAPALDLPVAVMALADYPTQFQVSAADIDSDSVRIVLDKFRYQPDSLKSPGNLPSYDGGNPGLFIWTPTQADTGTWIGSFSATDPCGAMDVHPVSFSVAILACGDCTGDGIVDAGDVVYLINYLFKGGAPPAPICRANADCIGALDVADVIVLVNYLFRNGGPPCLNCCGHS
ncbi:MAG: dockerin type I repeat-containing protein [Candidatus Zixiibacteriota bacterium]